VTGRGARVEWRPAAQRDLDGIVRHIGRDSPNRAARFGQEIRDKVGRLARHAELGRPGRISGVRELVVHPNYIVFYRVKREVGVVEILRVKHAAQRMP